MNIDDFTSKIKGLIMILLAAFLTILLYMVLHELGHALAAMLFGGEITDISLNFSDAHVTYSREELGSIQNAFIDVAGVLLPSAISVILTLTYHRKTLISYISLLLFIVSLASVIPFFIPLNNTDTQNFIRNSEMTQPVVSIIFGSLFLPGVMFLKRQRVLERLKTTINHCVLKHSEETPAEYLKHLSLIVIILLVLLAPSVMDFQNEKDIINFDKISGSNINGDSLEAFELVRLQCTDEDTLIVQITNVNAKNISINYRNSNSNEIKTVFSGSGLILDGVRQIMLTPQAGDISIFLSGKKLKAKISIFINQRKVNK